MSEMSNQGDLGDGSTLTLWAIACTRSSSLSRRCIRARHPYTSYKGTRRHTADGVSGRLDAGMLTEGKPRDRVNHTFVFFIRHRSQAFHTRLCRPSPMACPSCGDGGWEGMLILLGVVLCADFDTLEPTWAFLEL